MLDQSDFLLSAPAFGLLFSCNGIIYIIELFLVYQLIDVIPAGETANQLLFVGDDSKELPPGHTCIENCMMLIGENVYMI